MSLAIHIPQFEGPLGLLLYLIRKEEMDIFDIDIYLITSQYLDYIKKMKQFDLEVAGDFIAMAATLIQIKSKMLLPNYEEGEEEENIDPRKELVQKLLEYQRFQEASKKIYDRPLLGRDLWKRGGKSEHFLSDEEGDIILDEGGLFSLIALYRGAIRKMKKTVHTVAKKTQSIAARILEIKDRLIVGHRVLMKDLLKNVEEAKTELLMTFLSILELGKMGYVSVYQAENYGDIYLTAKRSIEGNVVERVEEYDTQNSEAIAENIMEKASEVVAVEMEAEELEEVESSTQTPQESFALEDSSMKESFEVATDEEIIEAEKELNIGEGELS